jgi:hypothetical protein
MAATTIRPKIYEFEIGSSVTPQDYSSQLKLMRYTTAVPTGGVTAQTGAPLDPGDPASIANAYFANTGGSTASTVLGYIGVNMRATFRWVAVPTKEIVVPATNPAGAGFTIAVQSTAYTPDVMIWWEE